MAEFVADDRNPSSISSRVSVRQFSWLAKRKWQHIAFRKTSDSDFYGSCNVAFQSENLHACFNAFLPPRQRIGNFAIFYRRANGLSNQGHGFGMMARKASATRGMYKNMSA